MSTIAVNYCVVCGDEPIRHESRPMEFEVRGETMHVIVPVMVCSACGTIEQTDVDPAELAFTQYREQKGLLTPEEIRAIRNRFRLSQKSLAVLLGMSEATINRYEGGGLQDEAHDQAIRSCATPEGMRDLLQRRGDRLSDWQLKRVEDTLCGVPGNLRVCPPLGTNPSGITFDLNDFSGMPREKSLTTGFRVFDQQRYDAVVVWFCRQVNTVTATSLNKLLFYADFLHYRNESVSLTGAAYRRVRYGPVPAFYGRLRELMEWNQVITVREVEYQNGNVGEEFLPGEKANDLSVQFSRHELATLEAVARKFSSSTPSQISEYSHNEPAWRDTEDRELISYEKASELSLEVVA